LWIADCRRRRMVSLPIVICNLRFAIEDSPMQPDTSSRITPSARRCPRAARAALVRAKRNSCKYGFQFQASLDETKWSARRSARGMPARNSGRDIDRAVASGKVSRL
jgi:hypothetical protein